MNASIYELQLFFFVLCIISILVFLIFFLRKNDNGSNYDKIIEELNRQEDENLSILDKGNKKIDKIEKEILKCKKKLNMKAL